MTLTVAIPSDDLDESVAQYTWPKECISTELCVKCGDSLELNLHQLRFSENLSRFRAGYYPFGSERADYDKLLGDTQVELDRCQKKIDRLEILRNKLIASTQLLHANKRLIHSILSPIHQLPLDILGNIFEHVCYDENQIYISDLNLSSVPTLKLTRVCYRWRSLVSSMPILWSTFQRSHPCPIDFEVDEDWHIRNLRSSNNMSTLLLHSHRWRHVEIRSQYPSAYLLQPLIKSGAQLPSLKSLTLETGGRNEVSDFPMTCANLKSLTLDRLGLELQFPRPTISRLVLNRMTCESALGVISRCPNVQDVVLYELDRGRDLPTPAYKCNANKLKLLSSSRQNATSTLLQGIHFDQLTSLNINDDNGNGWFDCHAIENVFLMLERSSTNLTSLSLRLPAASFSINRVLHVFSHMPLLTELELGEFQWWRQKRSVYPILKSLIASQTFDANMGGMDEDGGGLEESSNDEEDEAELDKDDKEDDTEIPEGVCLLPNLTKLRLIIRPRPKLLLKLLRSRWRPSLLPPKSGRFSSQESNRLEVVPDHGQCVCLRSFHLRDSRYPKNKLALRALRRSLESFKNDGMDVTVVD
ncbi:hypothetical protein DFH05DRAFT_1545485 [Lentinula detonsa]|uniref:F-box domain-containing protein n=1 Tax=Lentinula detonsa TaxID=2804962 RepID=A0A9W8NVJ3_9AGAR|nr:hypothetical protein DFH05DRAFT_1545485 [Lentinula detonsa]